VAQAREVMVTKETPNTDPFIQDMLRRTEEKREERAKARLNNYYKRNFKARFFCCLCELHCMYVYSLPINAFPPFVVHVDIGCVGCIPDAEVLPPLCWMHTSCLPCHISSKCMPQSMHSQVGLHSIAWLCTARAED
jgi:hypothetical protein